MFGRFFNRKARLFAGVDFMDLVPESLVPWESDGQGGPVVLLLPRYRDPLFGRLIQPRLGPRKRHVRMTLDGRGSWLWPRMDGRTDLRTLVDGFCEAFPDDQEQAAERISGYLFNMYEHKVLKFNNLS